MNITLTPVTRDNWQEALELQVSQEQSGFAPTVAISLAKVHIKPDGDNVEYLPFAIYHEETMVGFMMHAFAEKTTDMYWINGFLIDARYQGKGYGMAALQLMIVYKWTQPKGFKKRDVPMLNIKLVSFEIAFLQHKK